MRGSRPPPHSGDGAERTIELSPPPTYGRALTSKQTDRPTPVALPTDPAATREEALARRRAAEEEALLREVDDAVRQDDLAGFGQRYGRLLAVGAGVLVLGFGGYLFWQDRQDAARERQSETLVTALDQLQAGNLAAAASDVTELAKDGAAGPSASAQLLVAGAAAEQGRPAEAVAALNSLANDGSAPQALRDLAKLRLVALQFDTMDKAQVIAQLGPLARPSSPWFGSAGELVAMAYLEQGKRAEAGRLFADIARAEDVPDQIRSRTRQMAGVLGVDAIADVDTFLQQQRQQQQQSQQTGAPAPQPAA